MQSFSRRTFFSAVGATLPCLAAPASDTFRFAVIAKRATGLTTWGIVVEITEVRIFPTDEERFRAYVTVTFDNCFVIKGLKIIRGPKGHFVGMPSKRGKYGRRHEIISAIGAEARKMLEDKVFAEYEKLIGEPVTRRKLS